MPIPVNSILKGFLDIERSLKTFLDVVPLAPEHMNVWSPSLSTIILEACSQLDSLWKASGTNGSDAGIRQHFRQFGSTVAGRWLVVWGDEPTEVVPFREWMCNETTPNAEYRAIAWWQAYNMLKHDRWQNIRSATVENAVNAAAALFLALVRCHDCADAIVSAGWFHSAFAREYSLDTYAIREDPNVGITFESALFAYVVGALDPHFVRSLACYHGCTHRLGRWLEQRFDRSVIHQ